jgi:hypothetical protein
VLLLDTLVGNGGKAQSRFESSGDGGLARDGMVMPREGARNGDRPDDVLIGDMALEPRPLLAGVSSFGGTNGRPVDCQFPSGRDLVSSAYLLHSSVTVVVEELWRPWRQRVGQTQSQTMTLMGLVRCLTEEKVKLSSQC